MIWPPDSIQGKFHRRRAMSTAKGQSARAKRLGIPGSWTAEEWLGLCARFDFRCVCCGKRSLLESDHVRPLSTGGDNSIENIQPLCESCNASKNTKHADYREDAFSHHDSSRHDINPVHSVRGAHRVSRAVMAELLGVSTSVVEKCEGRARWPRSPAAREGLRCLAAEVSMDIERLAKKRRCGVGELLEYVPDVGTEEAE